MQANIMLDVEDVEASSTWYQELLGCQSGHGGADFEMLMDEGQLLMMLHRRSAQHHHASAPSGAVLGAGVSLYIRVEDIHSVAERATAMALRHSGVVTNPLAHQDELELRDPDGYFVTVCGAASWADPH